VRLARPARLLRRARGRQPHARPRAGRPLHRAGRGHGGRHELPGELMAGSDVSETRALSAMRAWRRGVGALEPRVRATHFASAHHYRGRISCPPRRERGPAQLERLLRELPAPARDTLWIFDLPGPLALLFAYELRRRFGVASALAWNGWYDPEGALDG